MDELHELDFTTFYRTYMYAGMSKQNQEQTQNNITGWDETGFPDMSNYNFEELQAYNNPITKAEFPLDSLNQQAKNGQNLDQGSGVVHLNGAQAGNMLLPGPHQAPYDTRENEAKQTRSDSNSCMEAQVSPESWASGSSQGGILPQADPSSWSEKELLEKELLTSPILWDLVANDLALEAPLTAPKERRTDSADTTDTAVVTKPKGKVRTAFSEGQLNMLIQRFHVQKYLSPIEMKNLAEETGLTYKQVKTWFQNHRMNLRRSQKDTSWMAERYAIYNNGPLHGPIFNMPSHIPPYQGGMLPQLQVCYNQHMMTAPPQNPALSMGAMNGPAGSAGCSSWPTGSVQSAVPNTPQVTSWPMPPEVDPCNRLGALNPPTVPPVNHVGNNIGFESRDVSNHNSFNPAMMYNPSL